MTTLGSGVMPTRNSSRWRATSSTIIYVKTPPPDFWKIQDPQSLGVFLPMAEFAEAQARRYGALVIDGTHHFTKLERFRKDSWHYCSQDYEFVCCGKSSSKT